MAGPDEDEREERPEDLFEDLDKYFAPIKDSDWPEGESEGGSTPPPAPPAGEAGTEDPDDWGDLAIDLPEEEELTPAASEASMPAAPGTPEPSGATGPGPSDSAVDDFLFEPGEGEADEWERFRRSLGGTEEEEGSAPAAASTSQAPAAEPESGPTGFEVPAAYGELAGDPAERPLEPTEAAQPADVEAAAEHFAESVRGSPEEVERELLADLEEPGGADTGTIRVDPAVTDLDAPPPPAWEQPTIAGPEDLERPAAAGGRNLPAAVISGALLAIGAVALLAIGNGPFAFLAAVVVLVGQGELYAVLKARGAQPATALGLIVGVLMVAGGYLRGEGAIMFGLFLAMALSVLWYTASPPQARKQVVQNVGATLLGVVYVPFMASFALVILRIPVVGRNLLLTVLGLTVLYDVCAYAIGSLWGSRPLAPTVSPKKSWEGAIGATFVLLLVALAIVPSIEPFTAARAVGLALVLAVVAPIGDLVESALKRDLKVKDMGSILPGHGGILDRIDSILLAAPAAYYFLLVAG